MKHRLIGYAAAAWPCVATYAAYHPHSIGCLLRDAAVVVALFVVWIVGRLVRDHE